MFHCTVPTSFQLHWVWCAGYICLPGSGKPIVSSCEPHCSPCSGQVDKLASVHCCERPPHAFEWGWLGFFCHASPLCAVLSHGEQRSLSYTYTISLHVCNTVCIIATFHTQFCATTCADYNCRFYHVQQQMIQVNMANKSFGFRKIQ